MCERIQLSIGEIHLIGTRISSNVVVRNSSNSRELVSDRRNFRRNVGTEKRCIRILSLFWIRKTCYLPVRLVRQVCGSKRRILHWTCHWKEFHLAFKRCCSILFDFSIYTKCSMPASSIFSELASCNLFIVD